MFVVFHMRLFLAVWTVDTVLQPWLRGYSGSQLRLYFWAVGLVGLFLNIPFVWSAVVLGFHGFWIPQIVLNAMRNTARQLDWAYLLAGSAVRLAPLLYFCFNDDNFLQLRVMKREGTVFPSHIHVSSL